MIGNYDFINSDIETVNCTGLNDLATNLDNLQGCLIFHLNIRSLNKHIDDLRLLINSMKVPPDIIICTETRKIIAKNLCKIDNYTMYCANAEINQNDGVCIYIKHNIEHTNEIITIGRSEALFTKVTLSDKVIHLTSLYRSHDITIVKFINDLYAHLHDKQTIANHFLISDMNIDILNLNSNSNNYLNNYHQLGYRSLINIPTRVTEFSATCIDHIFGKISVEESILSLVCDLGITDHSATLLHLGSNPKREMNYSKKVQTIDYRKLVQSCSAINWENFYSIQDVNVAVDFFVNNIHHAINKSKKTLTYNNKNRPRNDWITKGLVNSCKKKHIIQTYEIKSR